MRIALFYHSLVSDWNHGNAHFLRGITTELLRLGHRVRGYEPREGWSRRNLLAEHGRRPLAEFRRHYPQLRSTLYDLDTLDLHRQLRGVDLVLVHEWNDPKLVSRIGEYCAAAPHLRALFHDTHHRSVSDPRTLGRYDLSHYDGVLAFATGSDVVVKASGVGVLDAELERGVLDLQSPRTAVIYWDVDAPATLDRLALDNADPLRQFLRRYDLVLTYGGGEPVVHGFQQLGARQCAPIYNAVDPQTHHPVPPDSAWACDLLFVGNRLPDREQRVERFFLDPATRLPQRAFVLGGSGWSDKPMPTNVRYHGHVYSRDHNVANSSAGAVLNISRQSMASYGHSPATRVFEAAGAAACIITDRWDGLEQFLEPQVEVLAADDGAEVAEHVAALTPQRAHDIGQAALRRVLAHHTYQHRAQQLEALLLGESRPRPGPTPAPHWRRSL